MPEPDPAHDVWAAWFLGVQAVQHWADFLLWEKLLNAQEQVKCIVELGSLRGGFSMFLLLQAWAREAEFHTFDLVPPEAADRPIGKRLDLAAHWHGGDIFNGGQATLVGILQDPALHPMVLFCDNGDKPREFRTFVPMLQKGDVIGVHDWPTEFSAEHAAVVGDMVQEIYQAECDQYQSRTRFYRRI